MNNRRYSVAAVGNVRETSTFSGTPFHFWATAMNMGNEMIPWEVDLQSVSLQRKLWNVGQLLMGRGSGGYQYSEAFHEKLLKQIPADLLETNVIAFNQHFPQARVIKQKGGNVYYYIDATFRQLLDRYGVSSMLGKRIIERTLHTEKESFAKADHIFTMQAWAKESVVSDCGVSSSKVTVVLPGANILFPPGYKATAASAASFTRDRPLILGFVGKDWKRKGLETLIAIRNELESRGHHVLVRCAGNAPKDIATRKGIEFVGFIDKYKDYPRFISFLESCDIGCLFSHAEFSSISILEFISVGRPVAGFVVDGMGDLFIHGASLRFNPSDELTTIVESFERFITDQAYRAKIQMNAVHHSSHARWDRAVQQVMNTINHA